jgi:hypothetical protein
MTCGEEEDPSLPVDTLQNLVIAPIGPILIDLSCPMKIVCSQNEQYSFLYGGVAMAAGTSYVCPASVLPPRNNGVKYH